MYHMDFIGFRGRSCLCLLCVVGFLMLGLVTGNVVLIGKNFSVTFNDMEGSFAPPIKSSGECGMLYLAEPLDSCYPLTNKIIDSPKSPFALIIRGECAFDNKVRNAQKAGFKAAIIYDNEDSDSLVSMAGSSTGVDIHAIFVTRASGESLKKYAGVPGIYVWIFPTFDNSAWLIMAISFGFILAMSAVLATCFFVHRHHVRREQPRASHVAECHGMSSQLVKAMPSLVFTTVVDDNCTSMTCAICLEDYVLGDKLRVLPCRHKFHVFCVDSWLTSWRTFCPVCKRDARTNIDAPPASECTPLLLPATVSPSPATRIPSFHSAVSASSAIRIPLSPSPATGIPSFRSAVSASSAIRIPPSPSPATGIPSFRSAVSASSAFSIPPSPSRLPLSSRTHSLATTPQKIYQLGSFSNSPGIYISGSNRSSVDHWNMSSQQSLASYLRSSHSLGLPPSSVTLRYASPHARSPRHGSPNYLVGSCSRHSPYLHGSFGSSSYLAQSASRQLLLHNSESVTSFSALSSAQSLPEG